MSEQTSNPTSGQNVPKSKFRRKSRQEQTAASKLRMERRGEKLDAAREKLAKQKPPKKPGAVKRLAHTAGHGVHGFVHGKLYEVEHENVGTEGAHRSELVAESVYRFGRRKLRKAIRGHPAKAVERAESKHMEEIQMTTINLKDFYAWYTHDEYIEVSDEVAAELKADKLYEAAYQRRTTRNKAQYSLDCDDGIEYSACLHEPTPQELLDRMELFVHLWNALNSLPEVQGIRVEAHLILGKSYRQIAREQGVDKSAVRHSVKSGKAAMRKYLKKFL